MSGANAASTRCRRAGKRAATTSSALVPGVRHVRPSSLRAASTFLGSHVRHRGPATRNAPVHTRPNERDAGDDESVAHTGVLRIAPTALVLTANVLVIVGAVVAFFLSAALGANDVANSLGTAVGTGAIKLPQALVIGAVMEFAGAVLFGSTVTKTISSGVITISAASFTTPVAYMLGMLSVLVGCTAWMAIATRYGLPVSSTHSVVGALVGLGIVSGFGINYGVLRRIIMSWFLSPVIGAVIASAVYKFIAVTIVHSDRPARATRRILPFIAGGSAFVLVMFVLSKGARFAALGPGRVVYVALAIALAAGGLTAGLGQSIHSRAYMTRKFSGNMEMMGGTTAITSGGSGTGMVHSDGSVEEQREDVDRIFKILQVVTACLVAFSHGSNDVSNAIGPFAAMYAMWRTSAMSAAIATPTWILVLGGLGISTGLGLFGRPVMETVGKKITELGPAMGFAAELSTAITVLIASELGLPVSTTHTLIGCIVAIGLTNGNKKAVNGGVLTSIAASWGVTVPISALVTILFYMATRPLLPVLVAGLI
jgi:inorganic phosphate transporter, PiT family